MPPDNTDNPKSRNGVQTLPGVEILATASHRASRKVAAVQRTPVGRKILAVIQNLIWVVPLTMLVWLYAEREQLDERSIDVPITVKSDRPDRFVALANASERVSEIDIKGTRSRIEQARQALANRQGLQIVVPAQLDLGPQVPLPAMEAIAADPVFADDGSPCPPARPNTLTAPGRRDCVGNRTPPADPPGDRLAPRRPGRLDPPAVKVSGPKRVLTNPDAPVEVMAEITPQMLPKVAGTQEISAVPIRLKVPNEQVTLTPSAVKARVKLRSSTVSYVINSVPVFTYGPPALFDRYRVSFPNGSFLSRVTVVGPQDEINRISSGEFMPKAMLEIQQQDARERLPRSPSLYILPPNVTVSDEDKNRTITFELVDRTRTE